MSLLSEQAKLKFTNSVVNIIPVNCHRLIYLTEKSSLEKESVCVYMLTYTLQTQTYLCQVSSKASKGNDPANSVIQREENSKTVQQKIKNK